MAKSAGMGAGSKKMGGPGAKPKMPMLPPAGGMGGGGPMGPGAGASGGAFKKGGPVKKMDAKKGKKK